MPDPSEYRHASHIRQGVTPLVGFAILTAALDVYAGSTVHSISPMALAAISFSLTAAFFVALESVRQGLAATFRPLRALHRDVIAINVTTALTWLSMLYALKYLEPAVVSVTVVALGPILTVVLGPMLRRGSFILRGETWVSAGILAVLGLLVWESASGRSGVGSLGTRQVVAGFLFALACGFGSTANIIYMKRLSEAGQTPQAVLAIRFFLMIAVTWVMTAFDSRPQLSEAFWPAVLVAVIGVALPIYVLQIGIKHTEPITTSLLISASPLITLLLQLFDRHLHPSLTSFACTFVIVVLVAVGVVKRSQNERHSEQVRCAVVDAYGAGRLLPAALRRYGVDYLHVRSQFPDTNLSYLPEDFTLEVQHNGDVGETAARLRRHGVTIVVAAAESGVLLANELSAALGTPGNGMRCPEARRDKFAMHQAVRLAGLASAHSIESSSVDVILDWAAERGRWPVVLKPVASAGTDNVIFCDSAEAVIAAHAKISASTDRYAHINSTVLAQEFLVGEEHYVNTVSHEGVHQIIEVWHYYKRPVPGGRSINDFEDLLPLDDPGARRVAAYVQSVLDALEIRNGAAHTEVMLSADGPVLVECGARLGGGQMPDALSRCVGTNQIDSLALSIARPREFVRQARRPYRLLSHLRCVNLISETDGVVPPAERWAVVRALDSFAGLVLSLPEGGPVPRTIDLATCPGGVYLTSDDPAIIKADTDRLRELERTGLYSGA